MKEKKDCKIVQDLLPNYIDKLTSNETNQYIEEHINDCKDCKKILDAMQKDIQIEEKKLEKKKVKYIKKYNRRLKILKISLVSIILILVILFITFPGKNMMIIASLKDKFKVYDDKSDNVYIKITYYGNDIPNVTYDNYYKDGITKSIMTNAEANVKWIQYNYQDQEKLYVESPESKTLQIDDSTENVYTLSPLLSVIYYDSIRQLFEMSMNCKISTVELNGKECYVISNAFNNEETQTRCYIEKDTGLLVKMVQRTIPQEQRYDTYDKIVVTEFEYSFGTVTDEDMQEPDATEYTLIENEQ